MTGTIGITNPSELGTKFGDENTMKTYDVQTTILSDIIGRHARRIDTALYWEGEYVCKITDENGVLLQINGSDAVYSTLYNAFYDFQNKTFSGGTGIPKYIKMIVPEYEMTKAITIPNKPVILTTANRDDTDGYPYPSDAETDMATIERGNCQTSSSMFTMTANGDFTVSHVILDGESDKGVKVSAEGGLINTSYNTQGAKITIKDNAILENTQTTNSRNGGAIVVYQNCTLVTNNGATFKNCSSSANGGAIYTYANGCYNSAEDTYFINCNSNNNGGALYIVGDFVYNNSDEENLNRFIGCTAKEQGGAIYSTKSVTLTNVSFGDFMKDDDGNYLIDPAGYYVVDENKKCSTLNPSSYGYGGSIYAASNVNYTNTTPYVIGFMGGNAKRYGGAICSDGAVTINNNNGGGIFFGNHYIDASSLYNSYYCSGSAVYSASNIVLNNTAGGTVLFRNCNTVTEYALGGVLRAQGGSITLNNGDNGVIEFVDCGTSINSANTALSTENTLTIENKGDISFKNCIGRMDGAAIRTKSLNITENSGNIYFDGCSSRGSGGAIYTSTISYPENFGHIYFDNCSSSGDGGAIYVSSNQELVFKRTETSDIHFKNCRSSYKGGAIRTGSLTIINNKTDDLAVFENCVATDQGGAIYANGNVTLTNVSFGGLLKDATGNYLIDDNGHFIVDESKECTTLSSTTSYGYGGAVYAAGDVVYTNTTPYIIGFMGGYARRYGGGICTDKSATINNTNGGKIIFQKQTVDSTGIYNSYYCGGSAIYAATDIVLNNAANGEMIFHDCSVNIDSAYGGSLRANNGNITLNNGSEGLIEFTDIGTINTANSAIDTDKILTINNQGTLSFKNCATSTGGGAIFAPTINVQKNTGSICFENCSSRSGGGAIYSSGSSELKLEITETSEIYFRNCFTNSQGGAIYKAGPLTILNNNENNLVVFENCTAANNGGAIYANGNTTLTNISFGDLLRDDSGKYIIDENGNYVVNESTICRSDGDGGAVYAAGDVVYTNSTPHIIGFMRTDGYRYGGAVYAGRDTVINNTGDGKILFYECETRNTSNDYYGYYQGGSAVYAGYAITLNNSDNGEIDFYKCNIKSQYAYGGVLRTATNGGRDININNGINSTINFIGKITDNTANTALKTNQNVNIDNKGTIVFKDFKSPSSGGAINASAMNVSPDTGNMYFDNCTSGWNGGAIYLSGSSELKFDTTETSKIHFINCHSGYSGGAIYNSSGPVTIINDNKDNLIRFENCTATNGAGAIYTTSDVTLTDTTFGDLLKDDNDDYLIDENGYYVVDESKMCFAGTNDGGVIYAGRNFTFTNDTPYITGFMGSKAYSYGGAIYSNRDVVFNNTNGGKILFYDCKTTNVNNDYYGYYQGGSAIYAGYAITLNNGNNGEIDFYRCKGHSPYAGGGILRTNETSSGTDIILNNENNATIKFVKCGSMDSVNSAIRARRNVVLNNKGDILFNDCKTSAAGGAINAQLIDASKNTGNVFFEECHAKGNGGAIYLSGSSELKLETTETSKMHFINCHSGNYGGAIYKTGALTILNNNEDNLMWFENCTAKNNGGAIYTNGNISITNVSFGGIQTDENGNYLVDENGYYIVDDNKICKTTGEYGGTIYTYGNFTYTNTTENDIGFFGSQSKRIGGGIYINGSTTINNTGGGRILFEECKITNDYTDSNGGAMYLCNTLTLNNANNGKIGFNKCSSTEHGGAIYANQYAQIVIPNNAANTGTIEFLECSALGRGGAIYSDNKPLNIAPVKNQYVKFIDCSAESGGAIYMNNGTLTINGVEKESTVFENCSATSAAGGAIHQIGSTNFKVVNARFGALNEDGTVDETKGCVSKANGGAIYSSAYGTITINNCEFYGCKSLNRNAGAICFDSSGTYNITNSVFDSCEANGSETDGGGGAIYTYAGIALKISNSSFNNCYTTRNGGAISTYLQYNSPNLTVENSQFNNNVSGGKGSSIYTKVANNYFKNGTTITNGKTYDSNSGAIDINNTNQKIYLEGSVYIQGNIDNTNKPHNLVMPYNSKDIINTTSAGLSEDSNIGIYIPDQYFSQRGEKYKTFGTYSSNKNNLEAFTNDRLALVGGEKGTNDIAWTSAYRLVLDPNGGEGTPISVVLSYFKDYVLGTPYTKPGYFFAGWNTRKDGTGDSFEASDVVTQLTDEEGAVITLYAQWETYVPCTIYFHPNGGTEVPSRTVKPGTKLGLIPSTMRDHYTFVRWMLVEDNEEVSYSKDTIVDKDLHFYAVWEKRVMITFDAQGGIVGEDSREINPGVIGSLPRTEQPVETRDDYEFVRWYRIDEEGNKITVDDSTIFTTDDTLYAEWQVIKRRLRFFTNQGYPSIDPTTKTYWYTDYVYDLDEIKDYEVSWFPQVSNNGYTLNGWYTNSGEKIELGQRIDLRKVKLLSARWDATNFATITFNSDGGTQHQPLNVVKGQKPTHLPNPTKTNAEFAGWFLIDTNGQFVIEDGHEIEINLLSTINENINVKAKWDEYPTITFDSDGGSSCNPIRVKRGVSAETLPTPTKENSAFVGWYLVDGTQQQETLITSRTIIEEDITVKAKWSPSTLITFNWTEIKDEAGNPQITTMSVPAGQMIGKLPSSYQNKRILEGWYENEQFTGNKLTPETIINSPTTYYAKWISSIETFEEPIQYEYSISWISEPNNVITNTSDNLTWHLNGADEGDLDANAYVYFALKKTEGIIIPKGGIRINVPKYIFNDQEGQILTGKNNIIAYIPEYPNRRPNFAWNYMDNGNYYTILNVDPTDNVTLDLSINYEADIKDVDFQSIDAETGQYLDVNGNPIDPSQSTYTPRTSDFRIDIVAENDNLNLTHSKDLYATVYKSFNPSIYKVSHTPHQPDIYKTWRDEWGTKPADADEYYYVIWYQSSFGITRYLYGDPKKATTSWNDFEGVFSTTSKEWLPDAYEVVLSNNDYVLTRHKYTELINNQITLNRYEVLNGKWETGEVINSKKVHSRYIDFTVDDPGDPYRQPDKITDLNSSKTFDYWWGDYRGHETGQDQLLDGEQLSDYFIVSITGPGEENLIQKGDSNLYYAKEYTMIMRDGDPGDMTYWSEQNDRHIKLGDNDYRYTSITFTLENADGYIDSNGWYALQNTASSSWKPIEVWLRRKGELNYYKYTDVYAPANATRTISLPENTVGFEIRHTTNYWSTKLSAKTYIRINPTTHVKGLVKPDYYAKVESYFYNHVHSKAILNTTNEVIGDFTRTDWFKCGKTKTGLRTYKTVGEPTSDKFLGIQTIPIISTGYHYNNYGRRKPIYSGIFYELLPLGTFVDENSVYIVTNERISRSMYNVEYISDWNSTGQTMMVVNFGVPNSLGEATIELHYTLTNTFENLLARGIQLYIPNAFVNTSATREEYEILPKVKQINEIKDGQLIFSELENQHGQFIAYNSTIAKFLKINAFSSGFSKLVNTLNVFTDISNVIANTQYTYRLQYSQSEFAQSDNVVMFDLLDRGSITSTNPEWNGYVSQWQGILNDIQIPEVESSVNGKKCAPVLYYSTKPVETIEDLSKDLTDTTIWSTTKPADTEKIIAIAIDFSKAQDGTEFLMKGKDIAIVDVIMTSPAKEEYTNKSAVNTAFASARTYAAESDPEQGNYINVKSQTIVTMGPVTEEIHLTSLPESGTFEEPKLVAYKDTIEYDIAVTNLGEEFPYRNLLVEDLLPTEVIPEDENIYIYRNDEKEKSVVIGNSSRVSMTKDNTGKFKFKIFELLPGETLHIVIPTIVNTQEGKFSNVVKLTEINKLVRNQNTETTYHEVKKYNVDFGKKKLNAEPDIYLSGAILKLTDASGTVVDEWISSSEEEQKYHTVRIGAGEYIFSETIAPDNYGVAEPIRFTIAPDGIITVRGQEEPLANRTIDMYDKYIAVDTIVETNITDEEIDTTKEFTYIARITGLKGSKTYYTDSNQQIVANHYGAASFTFKLKHGESITFKQFPTGAHIEVIQMGTEYFASYKAVMVNGENQNILHSGETYLYKQNLTAKETEIDIDQGILHFQFDNRLSDGIPVRFIVRDYDTGLPIANAKMKLLGPEPVSGKKRFESEWLSTDTYKSIDLQYETSYTLSQIEVPESYTLNTNQLEITMDEEGILTCSDETALTHNDNGYIITIKNKKKAELIVENIGQNTSYYLAGAKFSLHLGDNQTPVQTWISETDKGQTVYLNRGTTYKVIKTSAAPGYASIPPVSVQVITDEDGKITVDQNARRAGVFNTLNNTLTFYDRYVETLTLKNTINNPEETRDFTFKVSGLKSGTIYEYTLSKNNQEEVSNSLTASETGEITFTLANKDSIILKDLPRNVNITEQKPEGTYYASEWKLDDVNPLESTDNIKQSAVSATLGQRTTIEVVNNPSIAIVRNKVSADTEWSEWKGFEYLIENTNKGAFNYANSLTGDITVETLFEDHERYRLGTNFDFNGEAITNLTLQSTASLTQQNKYSSLSRNFKDDSMFKVNLPNGIVTLTNITIDGSKGTYTNATQNGGIINVAAGTLIIQEKATLQNSSAINGAAVYVANGAKMQMTSGTITGNNATHGAGIYLAEGATLELSGTPNFTGQVSGTPGVVMNTAKAPEQLFNRREDIYIAGYLTKVEGETRTPQDAKSLVVSGAIDLDEGSIFVDAEVPEPLDVNNHYEPLKQFAIFDEKLIVNDGANSKKIVLDSSKTDEQNQELLDRTLKAFTNVYDNEYHAVLGDRIGFIYWDGVQGTRRVILQKTTAEGEYLAGAKFTITKGSETIKYTDTQGNEHTEFESDTNGVFFLGVLEYGVYVLNEIEHPAGYHGGPYYYLVIDKYGVVMSSPNEGYDTASEAKFAGDQLFSNRATSQEQP